MGNTADSYLYATDADGGLAMFDGAYGFSKVYAYGPAHATDFAYVHDAKVNIVTGFQRLA